MRKFISRSSLVIFAVALSGIGLKGCLSELNKKNEPGICCNATQEKLLDFYASSRATFYDEMSTSFKDIESKLKAFADSIKAFMSQDANLENLKKVRSAWHVLKNKLTLQKRTY